jgi:hypothetical protein
MFVKFIREKADEVILKNMDYCRTCKSMDCEKCRETVAKALLLEEVWKLRYSQG